MYITIQDTGIGMGKETQEEIFDKFVRAKNEEGVRNALSTSQDSVIDIYLFSNSVLQNY
jgi:signal transduction histidine kinase